MSDLQEAFDITTFSVIEWCIIAAIVIGAVVVFVQKVYPIYKEMVKKEMDKKELYERLDRHEQEIRDLKNNVEKTSQSVADLVQCFKEMHEQDQKRDVRDRKQDEKIDALMNAMMETMGDRIVQKANLYISKGGIPEDEVEGYSLMYKAYAAIGGNHGAEVKYKYCTKSLPILPVERKVINLDK